MSCKVNDVRFMFIQQLKQVVRPGCQCRNQDNLIPMVGCSNFGCYRPNLLVDPNKCHVTRAAGYK